MPLRPSMRLFNQAVQLLGVEHPGMLVLNGSKNWKKNALTSAKNRCICAGYSPGVLSAINPSRSCRMRDGKSIPMRPLISSSSSSHPEQSREHTLVDMGDDFYTRGKPHPMIDGTWRKQRILSEANDPSVAVLLLDFILGYNASLDPVGDLLEAIIQAKKNVADRGGYLSVVASICGTDGDPQDLRLQSKMLEDAGVVLFSSNTLAAKFCAELLQGR